MAGENDKSASQLLAEKPANPLTGAEILVVTQDGESRGVPLSSIIAYLLSGDARIDWGNIIGTLDDQEDLASALGGKADTGHTHAIAQVTGLQAALNGRALTGHTHTTEQVDGLVGLLAGKADTGHTHTMAQVSGLVAALAGKAGTSHSHGVGAIAGLTDAIIDLLYPIGTGIYVSWNETNPNTYLGRGTWERIAEGTYISGAGTVEDAATGLDVVFTAGTVSGEHSVTLGIENMPSHYHTVAVGDDPGGAGFAEIAGSTGAPTQETGSAGGGEPFYIRPMTTTLVWWRRTA